MSTTEIRAAEGKKIISRLSDCIFHNRVQLRGLQKHYGLFLPGNAWRIEFSKVDIEVALNELERQFKCISITHVHIRKFLDNAKINIQKYPRQYFADDMQDIRQPREHETAVWTVIRFDAENVNVNMAAILDTDCSDLLHCFANGTNNSTFLLENVRTECLLTNFSTFDRFIPQSRFILEYYFNFNIMEPTETQMNAALNFLVKDDNNCDCCGQIAKHACSHCYMTKYCSIECQKRSWPEHKKNCGVIEAISDLLAKIANGCQKLIVL